MELITVNRAEEITVLHSEIVGHLRQSLEKAVRIGHLLTEQKAQMQHGDFCAWIEKSLPFTDRTARNYMLLYRERDTLKTETVSDLPLTGAYKAIKKARVKASIEEMKNKTAYVKEHPEEHPEGKEVHAISKPAGYTVIDRVVGHINGLPIWEMEITDERFWKAEKNAAPEDLVHHARDIRNSFECAKSHLREARNAIIKIQKKYGALGLNDYHVDIHKGVCSLLEEIQAARKDYEKMRVYVEKKFSELCGKELTQADVETRTNERKQNLKVRYPIGWARWGNEAGLID